MNKIRVLPALVSLALTGCTSAYFPDPHHHVIDVHAAPWETSLAPDARLVWVDAPAQTEQIRSAATNQSATVRAYVVEKAWTSNSVRDHIQVEYLDTGRIYEIEGIPLEHRMYSDLVWIGDRYLVFDRWSSPHYGMHYVADTIQHKLILARPFPDQFYLDQ